MLTRFLKFIQANNLASKDDRVLMAVSGGIDSMVMADLFLRSGLETGIAHCNFCLRGRESEKDEAMVKKLAEKNRIPFFNKRFDTKEYAVQMGISTQMAARELRYTWFEEIRRKYNYNTIAVAHNLNDNIETILINLTRGTGITGLTGIKASGNSLIRPLLFAPRTEIEEYCNTRKIKYREDRSNAETKYVRNKIRHLVIPVLKEINPSIETTLVETAERMTGISEIVNEYIGNLRKEVLRVKKDISIIDTVSLDPYSGNKTILFEIFRPFGISGSNLTDLINIIKGRTGGYIVTSSHRIVRNRKELVITELIEDVFDKPVIISGLKQISGSDFISTAEVVNISEKFVIPADGRMAAFDYKLIKFPLIIRKWRPGDHFYPLGMNKRKKLSDYFTDRKYSLPDKENVRLLESEGKIMWIIGERIDNRFRITKNTKKVLVLKPHACLLSP